MTLSGDVQETKKESELGVIGAIQMITCIAAIIYVYLEYGLRLGLKKGGLYQTLRTR